MQTPHTWPQSLDLPDDRVYPRGVDTIAIGGQKGGTGKTTTAWNLGAALATLGRRVLLVDLDPQASLTVTAGMPNRAGPSMADALLGRVLLADIVYTVRPGLDLAPAGRDLAEAEISLVAKMGREWALSRALQPLADRYDYAILDLPPSLGVLTIAALAAAGRVLIPAIPQYLDLQAMAVFTGTVDLVRQELNPGLTVWGILPTFYDTRLRLHNDVLETWQLAGLPVLPLRVRRSIRLAEAPIGGRTLAEYAPQLAGIYTELARLLDGT